MANFTKTAIQRAFLTLLEDRPLGKITVKDIVETCGINRNTFYYHYEDLPALVEEIVMEEADRVISQFPTVDSLGDCLTTVLRDMLRDRNIIVNIYNSVNRDVYEFYLMKICEQVVTVYLRRVCAGRNLTREDQDLLIRLFKSCVYGLMADWIQSGMRDSALEDLRRLTELMDGYAEALLRRCEESGGLA